MKIIDNLNLLLNRKKKKKMLAIAMKFVKMNKIKGDYLEFGVYKGACFIVAYHFAQKEKLDMNFYVFDSFKGFPEIAKIDSDNYFYKGDCNCDINSFKKNISKRGVNLNKVKIVPGFYDKTLNKETRKKISIKKASIVYIDCDLYKSTVSVLNFITDYIQDGTILIFDDWFRFRGNPNKGEQRAFREWTKKNSIKYSQYHKFDYNGNSFIIHK